MIKSLYDKYFQKSKVFLFPLLGLPKYKGEMKTYIMLNNIIRHEDLKLICYFKDVNTKEFEDYRDKILKNKYFLEEHVNKEKEHIFIFSLKDFKTDYETFLKGKYSYLSDEAKMLIKKYHGPLTNEYKYVDTFLNPKEYYNIYSNLLSVDEDVLREVGELCDPYDINKEFLKFEFLVSENETTFT